MNIYSIYQARNKITNKSYIGFTSSSLSQRKNGHKHGAFTEMSQNKFYSAIREYGWENFEWSILYQSKEECEQNDSHTLNVMEDFFIQEFNSLNDGYNTTPGGGKFPVLRGENNGMHGRKHKEESISLMRQNRGDTSGENNPMYGIKRTDEWLDAHTRGVNHPMYGKSHRQESIDKLKNTIQLNKKQCTHCNKIVDSANYNRWHNDNCKFRTVQQ
jgi:group I intron endonuclease